MGRGDENVGGGKGCGGGEARHTMIMMLLPLPLHQVSVYDSRDWGILDEVEIQPSKHARRCVEFEIAVLFDRV